MKEEVQFLGYLIKGSTVAPIGDKCDRWEQDTVKNKKDAQAILVSQLLCAISTKVYGTNGGNQESHKNGTVYVV